MAGHFSLGQSGVSMGGPAFRRFAQRIKDQLPIQRADIHAKVDEDVELFEQIRVSEFSKQDFQIFAQAAIEASQADDDPAYRSLWDELVTKVKAEPRYAGINGQPS
jgi:hypothetical protein